MNKTALQKECGLPVNPDIPLIGIVTRLTWQKGLDLIINRMDELMKRDVQIVVLGAGDLKYEEPLKAIAAYHNQKLSLNLKFLLNVVISSPSFYVYILLHTFLKVR